MDFLKKLPINWPLMANPVNWIIIWLMLALASVMLALITSSLDAPMKNED